MGDLLNQINPLYDPNTQIGRMLQEGRIRERVQGTQQQPQDNPGQRHLLTGHKPVVVQWQELSRDINRRNREQRELNIHSTGDSATVVDETAYGKDTQQALMRQTLSVVDDLWHDIQTSANKHGWDHLSDILQDVSPQWGDQRVAKFLQNNLVMLQNYPTLNHALANMRDNEFIDMHVASSDYNQAINPKTGKISETWLREALTNTEKGNGVRNPSKTDENGDVIDNFRGQFESMAMLLGKDPEAWYEECKTTEDDGKRMLTDSSSEAIENTLGSYNARLTAYGLRITDDYSNPDNDNTVYAKTRYMNNSFDDEQEYQRMNVAMYYPWNESPQFTSKTSQWKQAEGMERINRYQVQSDIDYWFNRGYLQMTDDDASVVLSPKGMKAYENGGIKNQRAVEYAAQVEQARQADPKAGIQPFDSNDTMNDLQREFHNWINKSFYADEQGNSDPTASYDLNNADQQGGDIGQYVYEIGSQNGFVWPTRQHLQERIMREAGPRQEALRQSIQSAGLVEKEPLTKQQEIEKAAETAAGEIRKNMITQFALGGDLKAAEKIGNWELQKKMDAYNTEGLSDEDMEILRTAIRSGEGAGNISLRREMKRVERMHSRRLSKNNQGQKPTTYDPRIMMPRSTRPQTPITGNTELNVEDLI